MAVPSFIRHIYAALFDRRRLPFFALTRWLRDGGEVVEKLPQVERLSVDADGAWFRLRDGSEFRYLTEIAGAGLDPALFLDGYEPGVTTWMKRALGRHQSGTMIDVGANIGWFTVQCARAYPWLRVEAFEPGNTARASLSANVGRNDLGNRVLIHALALSDVDGTVRFSNNVHGHALNHILAAGDDSGQEVHCARLDSVLESRQDFHPIVLKADIEGAELVMLEGAQDLLRRHHPDIFLEINPEWTDRFGYEPRDIYGRLAALGYQCRFVLTDGNLLDTDDFDAGIAQTNDVLFTCQADWLVSGSP